MRRSAEERRAFLETRAAQMAANPTSGETALWTILEPLGFWRQVPIAGMTKNGGVWQVILDFYHPTLDICVEVDGSSHRTKKGRDRRRDTRLQGEGVKTLRFTNNQVLRHSDEVRARVVEEVGK
jgi:cyclase